jgi:hypothetical protein
MKSNIILIINIGLNKKKDEEQNKKVPENLFISSFQLETIKYTQNHKKKSIHVNVFYVMIVFIVLYDRI